MALSQLKNSLMIFRLGANRDISTDSCGSPTLERLLDTTLEEIQVGVDVDPLESL
jgi:hypothetical protein